jgi:hypothetical protein
MKNNPCTTDYLHTYHNIICEIKFKNHKNKWSTNTQAKISTMKYHRFNRRRSIFGLYNFYKSSKKRDYMVKTGRSKLLDSFYFENQVWGALHKCWKGYIIAKNKGEDDKMQVYARRIQECQHDLGLPIDSFDNLGMSATSFLWEFIRKEDNDSQEQQALEEEQNYQGDSQYERERFTDTYTEDFKDDENKADRFTDDYHENFTD